MVKPPLGYVSRALEVYRERGARELAGRGSRFAAGRTRLLKQCLVGGLQHRRLARGETDADPYTIKWADPADIEYVLATRLESRPAGRHLEVVRRPSVSDLADYGDLLAGTWDRERVPVTEYSEWELVTRRFVDGEDWMDLELYDECLERVRSGRSIWGCTSKADLQDRFAYLDRLAESIATDGYQRNTDPDESIGIGSVGPAEMDEVTVDIGRDGTLLHYVNGRHRLALAVALDVDEIPVLVRVRHSDWQAIRRQVATADAPAALSERTRARLDHPDLDDVVPDHWRV